MEFNIYSQGEGIQPVELQRGIEGKLAVSGKGRGLLGVSVKSHIVGHHFLSIQALVKCQEDISSVAVPSPVTRGLDQ